MIDYSNMKYSSSWRNRTIKAIKNSFLNDRISAKDAQGQIKGIEKLFLEHNSVEGLNGKKE